MTTSPRAPASLGALEHRLRTLLPAHLYADAWVAPTPEMLERVVEHLRTLLHILTDYVSPHVSADLPAPGQLRHSWQEGALMFTDLAGFTPFIEALSRRSPAEAEALLVVLTDYFAAMIDAITQSGGAVLEFTGDALLAQFPRGRNGGEVVRATRAGLRMQRAMARFARVATPEGEVTLGMRVGLHRGRFFAADVGTPRRMEHVLLGRTVTRTKAAEQHGRVGRVCLSPEAAEVAGADFRLEPGKEGYAFVVDDLAEADLGEFDVLRARRRTQKVLLMDRSGEGLLATIAASLDVIEPLASFIPEPVLHLLVEHAERRRLPADFPAPTVLFVNLLGLPEAVDDAAHDEEEGLAAALRGVVTAVDAAVTARGGTMKKVTCQVSGSDVVIYFGAPLAHTDDPRRAAEAALDIRAAIARVPPPTVGGRSVALACQLGLARGPCFAAEVGKPRGQREYNVIGDPVNTAARLMSRAAPGQILLTEAVAAGLDERFALEPLEPLRLKGKSTPVALLALHGFRDDRP